MATDASDRRAGIVDNLTLEWDLNECEAGDLASFGEILGIGNPFKLDDESFMVHMEMRAMVLKRFGSPTQEMYDEFERFGRENRDRAGPEETPA